MFLAFVFLFLFVQPSAGSDKTEDQKAVVAGYSLVEKFYTCVISENLSSACNDILDIKPYNDAEGKPIWSYIRSNREIFITRSNLIKETNFFKWSRKSVTYFNPHDLNKITDGQLYITIVHTLPGRNDSGVYKEIAFPIAKEEKTGVYKIAFGNIKINGILLNYESDLVRNFNILKTLGFKDESGNTFGQKK
jgi:hypothetical protein